ncbi:hypothetical protein EJ110_NYTH39375 [Nymphaea thermarum]|nr:hypothetical protein EJ110_NYTH39375 [Nymphaea thermarum]
MESASFYRLGIPVPWLLLCCAFLLFPPGILSTGVVTLKSIEIFTTHESFFKPVVYFQCKGENKTILPDVEKAMSLYAFKGQESWQPLTELPDNKCKRCGLYEQDTLKSDDIFDEWELCPDDFLAPDGRYIHFKAKEFNASFLCPQCLLEHGGHESNPPSSNTAKHGNVGLVVLVVALSSCLCAFTSIAIYKYWQKRKREQDQARFLKLFEQDDDIDAELGHLGNDI